MAKIYTPTEPPADLSSLSLVLRPSSFVLCLEFSESEERKAKVAKLKITQEGITKDEALAAIELWMRDFYAVAKIALDDKVKLMKALRN